MNYNFESILTPDVSPRSKRVASEILKQLGGILITESMDLDFKIVTLNYCVVSKDLTHAKIYFSTNSLYLQNKEEISQEQITKKLNKASGFFRTRLAKKIKARLVPTLRFYYDETIDESEKMEKIFRDFKK